MIKKINLINGITPLYKLNYKYGDTSIWIKRDDLLDFAFGGNKVRLFEYIAAMIEEKEVRRVVTYGSLYSNFVRVTAAVCSLLNIECDLIILDESYSVAKNIKTEELGGNSVLIDMFDVNIIHCPTSEAHDFIEDYKIRLKKEQVEYLWIPGGGHIPEAGFGYVDAAREMDKQIDDLGIDLEAVFVPCGTGTTQAGLIYGLCDRMDVIGISVARTAERCIEEIRKMLIDMRKLDKQASYLESSQIKVISDNKSKYGVVTDLIKNTIACIAKSDGLFLDPIYNGKAFCGMMEYLDNFNDKKYKNVLYLNTGGQPNLFLKGKI